MKKLIGFPVVIILLTVVAFGCGMQASVSEPNNSSKEDIRVEIEKIVDAFDSGEASAVEELFFDAAIEQYGINQYRESEIERFLEAYSGSKRVFVDCGGYLKGDKRVGSNIYTQYQIVEAIIETQDNIFALNITFYVGTKGGGISALRVVSGKTESYENLDFFHKNYDDYKESFSYVDFYEDDFDEIEQFSGNYDVIFGSVLGINPMANELSEEETRSVITLGETTVNDLKREFGDWAAEYRAGYHFIYYKLKKSDLYIQFSITEEETVDEIKVCDELYPGWVILE